MNGPPRRILLATDLSARCDRALDRAVSLREQWRATLVIVHVLEELGPELADPDGPLPSWRRPPDPVGVARKRLLADIGPLVQQAKIVTEEGDPSEVILRTPAAEGCDLIVTGIARDELLGRFRLGSTVDRLLRRSRVPLLVVKERAGRPYARIVVATDLSEPSRHALEAAAQLFPEQRLTVFHAYHARRSTSTRDSAAERSSHRTAVRQECEAFLQGASGPAGWQPPEVVIAEGAPDALLRDYVRDLEVDLVVLGTHGRSGLLEVFLGSIARRIMDALPCDALIVRGPAAATAP